MAVRVLVVDDSRFFRKRVKEMLESDARIKVIGYAENGLEAVDKASRLKPDIVTMDIEMPIMDGITATKRILSTQNIPILMFSSLTTEGAQATLDALDAGAVDFLPKRFEDISNDKKEVRNILCDKVVSVVRQRSSLLNFKPKKIYSPPPNITKAKRQNSKIAGTTKLKDSPVRRSDTTGKSHSLNVDLVVIGTSTGGPVALQQVLVNLQQNFPVPLLLVQHMPSSFTKAFAQRLNNVCKIAIDEAQDRDELHAGKALLAPGGKQMLFESKYGKQLVRIREGSSEENYKPCIDRTLDSIPDALAKKTLVIILTGMGADGCIGAQRLYNLGAHIWAQDEETSVVYGMPGAVNQAGIVENIYSLESIGMHLSQRV